VYLGQLRKHRFVFKHLILCTLRKKRSVTKKRDVDFCKGNIRQLTYSKYLKDRIHVILHEM